MSLPLSRHGWICPVCKRVYAPWVGMCSECSGGKRAAIPDDPQNAIDTLADRVIDRAKEKYTDDIDALFGSVGTGEG